MQKEKKRDSLSVSVDDKEPTEVEIRVDKVSEEIPMDLDKPVSSKGQSGVKSTPKDVVKKRVALVRAQIKVIRCSLGHYPLLKRLL